MTEDFTFLLLVALSLMVSFFLSGMEAGVFALSRVRIRQQMRAGKRNATLLHGYLQDPENFLWTLLTGNTLATFIAFSLIILLLYRWLGHRPLYFILSFLVLAYLFYIFFDLLPKMLFQLFPNRLCLVLVTPFRFIHMVLRPLVALFTLIANSLLRLTGGRRFQGHLFGSRSEFRTMMQESAYELSPEERAMINRVLDLQNVVVRSITVPLDKVVSITVDTLVQRVIEICRDRQLTRLPVWQEQGTKRTIVGVVNLRQMLYAEDFDPEKTASNYMKSPLYLREDVRLEEALHRMQRTRQRLAIVLDHEQREVGVVSLEDVLRKVFGEVNL